MFSDTELTASLSAADASQPDPGSALPRVLDTLADLAAHRMGARHGSLDLVDRTANEVITSVGRSPVPAVRTLIASVVAERRTVVVGGARESSRTDSSNENDVPDEARFYVGTPVVSPGGLLTGVLSVWDADPRTVGPAEIADLEQLARLAADLVQMVRERVTRPVFDGVAVAITELMDLIVSGATLNDVLDTLARTVEATSPETVCTILLLRDMKLHHGAAPSVPDSMRRAFDGANIGPTVGSCGTAAYTRQTVIVADIANDPLWEAVRGPALAVGLRACWSVPIIDSSLQVLGTFALYYREVRVPLPQDLRQMTRWVDLAEVAISRARYIAALRDAATQDALTGLTNRAEALRVLAEITGTSNTPVAVLFIDLDQFKFVNDTLGHAAGDQYLIEVSRRLSACVGQHDTVARIGGDEFLLICPGVDTAERAQVTGNDVVEVLRQPLPIEGTSLSVSVSVGIALRTPGAEAVTEDLVADADLAMYAAKRAGRNSVAVYDQDLRAQVTDRMRLEADLNQALSSGELFCAYQPIVDMTSGRLIGVETLARWTSATRGEVPPTVFIAAAEDSGQIGAVGEFVLRTACAQMAAWLAADRVWKGIALSVNVSPRQLADLRFPGVVEQVLADTGLPAGQLWLEITEGTLVPDPSLARTTVTRLRGLGIRIAIDDFGTGFSSLAQLKHLPADVLKIDRSFVTELAVDPAAAGIIQAVVTLAGTARLGLTAEGIETEEQRRILLDLGCRYGQGFLWSRPLSPQRLGELAGHRWPAAALAGSAAPAVALADHVPDDGRHDSDHDDEPETDQRGGVPIHRREAGDEQPDETGDETGKQ